LRELGETIDLHGGGSDLIFPHHECERAQSESVTGKLFVRHWMHVAMVFKDGAKMSKSLGNLEFVDALRRQWDPRAIRLAIIKNHYRREWEWTDELMPAASTQLGFWIEGSESGGLAPKPADSGLLQEVRACLDQDLDTPAALATIDAAAQAGHDVGEAASLLGVDLRHNSII
jgi:L-cysteine:1D-myo-inositol 2-amino-2-deoxy-alpha-D-glucopyranoside ligase